MQTWIGKEFAGWYKQAARIEIPKLQIDAMEPAFIFSKIFQEQFHFGTVYLCKIEN